MQISECLRVCQRVLAWDVRPQRQRVIGDKHLAAQLAHLQADTQRADAVQRWKDYGRVNQMAAENGVWHDDTAGFISKGGIGLQRGTIRRRKRRRAKCRGCIAILFKQRDKVPFAAHVVRPQAQDALRRSGQARQRKGDRMKIRMLSQKTFDAAFVFKGIKGACAVGQSAAGAQHLRSAVQNLSLTGGAAGGRIGVPFGTCFRMAAEHALARAGRVHQNLIKEAGPARRQSVWIGAGYNRVFNAHTLDIAG